MNNQSLGVCFRGEFHKQIPAEPQYRDGAKLIAQLLSQEELQINDITPDRDFDETVCSGKNFDMNELKQYILGELNLNVKVTVQEVIVTNFVQNAINNLAAYGIMSKEYRVTKDHEITLISMLNGLVKAIKDGKLKVGN
ncbi:N-acetylmuramoyl-L-alanine amidase [Metabacillus fastidiosus]|uniref:peptidoglycan recognition protein family protein n=1 Tax=Metabacillus fastidiosus TaxID=1458 RepID=UPI002DB6E88B|nr:N-acetylmuramoyl-L-alanine amidase [Metabacillus fastidiosus]